MQALMGGWMNEMMDERMNVRMDLWSGGLMKG